LTEEGAGVVVKEAGVSEFILGDRGQRNVRLDVGGKPSPLGMAMADEELVISESDQVGGERVTHVATR
jgi:hypothetical protein